MINLLKIDKGSIICDPFIGSGTNLVSAKENGINSIGFDVNDFYVFISRVKIFWDYDLNDLENFLDNFFNQIKMNLSNNIFLNNNSCFLDDINISRHI